MTLLYFLRLSNNLTQGALEAATGVKRWKISLAESGRMGLSDEDLKRIGGYFKVREKSLLEPVKAK